MTSIDVNARRLIAVLLVVLIGIEIFFVIADVVFNVDRLINLGPIRRFFNIAREDGVASWFAVIQTWMLGVTAAFLYVLVRADDAVRWRRIGWAVIALFILYMAMDDGARFHERVGTSVKMVIEGDPSDIGFRKFDFFPSYTWQLVFLPIFAAFGVFVLWFLNKELGSVRDKLMVVVAIGLLVLAVLADFFEGLDVEHPLNLHGWITAMWQLDIGFVRHYSKSLEEFMEMLAMSLLWVVLLRHLVWVAPEIQLRFRNLPQRPVRP